MLLLPSRFFSRMRSEGFSFYIWGCFDLCSRDLAFGVRNRPQPFATVYNRLQPFATVCNRLQPSSTVSLRPSWAQSCRDDGNSRKNVTFLTCQKLWSCRFAWQAWHFVAFQHVSRRVKKSFCVAGAILLLHFQKMCCIIRGRRSTLGTSNVIFRGRRSSGESHCQRCPKW